MKTKPLVLPTAPRVDGDSKSRFVVHQSLASLGPNVYQPANSSRGMTTSRNDDVPEFSSKASMHHHAGSAALLPSRLTNNRCNS
jgi:hypothetical protein